VGKQGIVVGNGYGKMKSATFRIGHMGDHNLGTIERCLAACSSVLRS
jgi:aspartate aminotransferase-like enzyme